MRIIQINNNHYRKGGTDSVYLNLINLLRSKGHYVIPFSFDDVNNQQEEKSNYFIKKDIFNNNLGKFYSFPAKRKLIQLIENEKPEIAHIHNIIGGISLSILPILKKNNIPVLVTMHGFKYLCPAYVFINGRKEICEDCKVRKYYKCITNKCAPKGYIKSAVYSLEAYMRDFFIPFEKYVDHYHFVSNFFLEKYCEYFPQIRSRSTFFPNFLTGLDEAKIPEYRKGDYFLFVGRVDREKGIKTLISAFENLQDMKLKIVGVGELSNYISDKKLKNVDYVGYKNWNEIKELLTNCSYLIIPSECYENNPMTIIEAYSVGKPVIASNIGGIPEIIKSEETGFLFEMGNEYDLIEKIKLANNLNEKSYLNLSENSFKFAQQFFATDVYYQKLINLYEELLKE